MVDKKRGRPKKVEKKEVEKVVVKKATPKTFKVKFLRRVTHFGKTYEVGEICEEKDKEMVKQLVDKGFGVEV